MSISKWAIYKDEIKLHFTEDKKSTELAQFILNDYRSSIQNRDIKEFARYIRRHAKTICDLHEGIYNAADSLDISSTSAKHMWLKSKEASLFVKNPNYIEPELANIEKLRDDLVNDLKQYSPSFPSITRVQSDEPHLLVIDPADIHLGKLCSSFETGEDYNSEIAIKRAKEGVLGILDKVSAYHIDKILFIGGNDILHVDNAKHSTTSLTQQDTDGMWYDNFMKAKQLYVDLLEMLISIADVHFTFNPSNHDYTNGFFLAQIIQTYFAKCSNITFDCSMAHRKAFRYHNNLIGTTHGDGAKTSDLPLLMACEYPLEWSKTKHRYVYTHHVHHKTSKDFAGITVESLRSPSGNDSWHHRNGFCNAAKAVEGFLHHPEYGQIARITHLF